MRFERKFVFVLSLCTLLGTAGCDQFGHKKKASLPPRTIAPTLQVGLPDAIPTPPPPPAPVVVAQEAPKQPEPKPAPKTRHRSSPKKTTPAATNGESTASSNAAGTTTGATTVANNIAPEPPVPNTAIAAVVPSETATRDKQTTAELLDSAEKTIKSLDDHSLSDDQKAMVSQIWSFIAQSRKATIDGDLERALNLANKAHLLSDALVKK